MNLIVLKSKPSSRLVQSGILFGVAAAVPIYVVSKFLIAAGYAFPESDDYCFFFKYRDAGLFGLVGTLYQTLVGRVVPLVLIAVPGMVTRGSVQHLVEAYPSVLVSFALLFAGSMVWVTVRLYRDLTADRLAYLSISLVATIFASCEDPRELLYWMPGVACYAVPAALVAIVLAELCVSARDGSEFSLLKTSILAALSFISALCNEFTPIWLIGIVLGSFLFRRLSGHSRSQAVAHLALLIATLAGFAILLAAPANSARMGQFQASGNVIGALIEAAKRAPFDWTRAFVIAMPWSLAAGLCSTSYHDSPRNAGPLAALFAGLAVLLFGCSYVAHFVGYFATGTHLAPRASNEIMIVLVVGFACAFAAIGPLLFTLKLNTISIATACMLLTAPMLSGSGLKLMRAEWPLFEAFRAETLHRENLLLSATKPDVAVPSLIVRPRLLVGQDLSTSPDLLPNDCVAAAYGLKTVVLQ